MKRQIKFRCNLWIITNYRSIENLINNCTYFIKGSTMLTYQNCGVFWREQVTTASDQNSMQFI